MNKKIIISAGLFLGIVILIGIKLFFQNQPTYKMTNSNDQINPPATEEKSEKPQTTTNEPKTDDQILRLNNLENIYKTTQFIPKISEFYSFSDPNYEYNFENKGNDCVGIEGGNTLGGDLLSSLANDKSARENAQLKIYTKEYITTLKSAVNEFIETNYNKSIFAFDVCHLADGVDIVSGHIWSKDRSPYFINNSYVDIVPEFLNNKTVLLANNGTIYEIKDVQSLNSTATGGEVYPCDHTFSDNIINWKCFAGLGVNEATNITFGKYQHWQISLDGKIIKTWDTTGN